MLRVPYPDLLAALSRAILTVGVDGQRAFLCATLIAETTRDGVYTHGLNRFPRLQRMIQSGAIDPRVRPTTAAQHGAIERWDAHRGIGNLAAHAAMSRAIALARSHGLGAVALRNTSHWLRGGTYGWLAADAGLFALCWTNTLPNLPAWGGTNPVLGNNPLVMAIPRRLPDGTSAPIVLDMAASQFSYGTLHSYSQRGDPLPVPGGYDTTGQLTTDAASIEASQRALPIGFWKGSGLAIALDLFASILSGGQSTHELPRDPDQEVGISQFFLAIDPATLGSADGPSPIADSILTSIHASIPVDPSRPVRYPGEQTLRLREENLRLGVPVDPEIWATIA